MEKKFTIFSALIILLLSLGYNFYAFSNKQ